MHLCRCGWGYEQVINEQPWWTAETLILSPILVWQTSLLEVADIHMYRLSCISLWLIHYTLFCVINTVLKRPWHNFDSFPYSYQWGYSFKRLTAYWVSKVHWSSFYFNIMQNTQCASGKTSNGYCFRVTQHLYRHVQSSTHNKNTDVTNAGDTQVTEDEYDL